MPPVERLDPGRLCGLDELRGVRAGPPLPTGIAPLDAAYGGILPGTFWVLVGHRGVGVTDLALSCVVAAEASGRRVAFANGHLAATVLAERLTRASQGRLEPSDPSARQSLLLASEWTLPHPEVWTPSEHRLGLLVYDTLKDATPGAAIVPNGPEPAAALRRVREVARDTGAATLGTVRVAPPSGGLADVRRAWRTHRLHEAAMDAADLVVTLWDADDRIGVVVESRLGPDISFTLARRGPARQRPDDSR